MDAIVWKFNLAVKNVRGKDEFEMYKNYINDLPFERIGFFMNAVFNTINLRQKSDSEAVQLRNLGNNAFKLKNYEIALRFYTKSLRYASYNSKEYALALANRSAVHFAQENYKSSLADVYLCLKANYPNNLKPKAYIRKALCYRNLGEDDDMRKTLLDLFDYLSCTSKGLLQSDKVKYEKMVKELIVLPTMEKPKTSEDNFDELPSITPNPKFLYASSSVALKYNKRKGYHVVAKKEIAPGEVLFVEEAYAFAPIPNKLTVHKECRPTYCQYCSLNTTNSVPCKNCVKHQYCNEKCRVAAWKEFHQWECLAVQARLFNMVNVGHLALRIVFKALFTSSISTDTINIENAVASYGNKDNNYPYVYNLPTYINKMEKHQLMEYVATSALLVHYLKLKTNFFQWMERLPAYSNKGCKNLMNKVGGLILRHCGQFHHNIVLKRVPDNAHNPKLIPIAVTVCPSITMMNHSCISNTALHFVGKNAIIKATENIKFDEEIYYTLGEIPYITLDKASRQAILRQLYYQNCSCRLCSDKRMDKHDSYLCINCKGAALQTDSDLFGRKQYACLDCNCKFVLPAENIIREKLVFAYFTRFIQFNDLDDANKCLKMAKTVFTQNHSIFDDVHRKQLEIYKDKSDLESFFEIGNTREDFVKNCQYFRLAESRGLLSYTICLAAVDILQTTALDINIKDLEKALNEASKFLEIAKLVFSLRYPPFAVKLRKVEKSIFELRILHTLRIANQKLNK